MGVDLTERVNFFENYILLTKNSIRLSFVLAFAVFASGVICAILLNVVFSNESDGRAKLVGSIGSCLVTLLSAAPLKDYFSQRAKINNFQFLKARYEKLNATTEGRDEAEVEKLEAIFWGLVKT